MPFHVSCSLSVGKGRQATFPLTLRVGAKHGYIMDELGCIQQAPETKCFPHQRKTAGNLGTLIDFINMSKERMCQSERGFEGEGPRMKRRALAVRFPGVQRERVLTSPQSIWPSSSGPLSTPRQRSPAGFPFSIPAGRNHTDSWSI